MPVNLPPKDNAKDNAIVEPPFMLGITLPTASRAHKKTGQEIALREKGPAFAAPVEDGMIFSEAQRPPRQSLPPLEGPSTVSCVAVMACTVVIKPSTMPKLSLITSRLHRLSTSGCLCKRRQAIRSARGIGDHLEILNAHVGIVGAF